MPRGRAKTSTITLTPDELQDIIQKAVREATQVKPSFQPRQNNGRGPQIGANLFDTMNMGNLVPIEDNYTIDPRTGQQIALKTPGVKEKRETQLIDIDCSVCRRHFEVAPILVQKSKDSGMTYTCDTCIGSRR
jgi:hypothetical protein